MIYTYFYLFILLCCLLWFYVTMAIKYTVFISEPVSCILTEWNVINWSLIRVPMLIYVNIICIAKRLFAHIHVRRKVTVWERRAWGFGVFHSFLLILLLFFSQRIQAPPITAHNELHQIITSFSWPEKQADTYGRPWQPQRKFQCELAKSEVCP